MVNRADKPIVGEGVYSSVSDPARRGSEAATAEKDWTIQRPKPEKVEELPSEPVSKMLMDHLQSLWVSSASAVQVQSQVKDLVNAVQTSVNAPRGTLVSEVLTYSPTKINKTEKPQ